MFTDAALVNACLPPVRIVRRRISPDSRLRGGVIALGNFDGFHRGHRLLVARAQAAARGRRPVGVMSVEPHPREFFAPQGTMKRIALPAQKHAIAWRLGLDFIFEPRFDRAFAAITPEAFVADVLHDDLGVSHIVTGADFRFGAGRSGGVDDLARLAARHGMTTEAVAHFGSFSSTGVREALAKGDLRGASHSLGRYWSATICEPVTHPALAPGLVRPPPGRYELADPITGRGFVAGLDGEGRILAGEPCPPEAVFLRAL
ncbi:hypothetical protein [Oricola sp.]|uniref:hypothetical protein n=1 Tax=Oricola sp. TaxID=1979950 RepID=UPI003BA9F034